MDPKPPVPTNQNGPQPSKCGQMFTRPDKYLSMEYITLYLKSTEYDFLRELSRVIKTPEKAYGISCVTNLPEATLVCIRKEHTCFGLSVKEIQSWIVFHVLAIWYISAKGVYNTIPLIKDMFYDLELEDECAEILDKFPWLTSDIDVSGAKSKTNNIQMRTKVLGKGQKSKSSTTASQSNCSSISPLNPIRENGEMMDMKEQMPELIDDSENEDSDTSVNQQSQSLRTFGQAHLNNMGAPLKVLVKV